QISHTLTNDIIISGVTSEDEGVYECEYVAPQLKKRVSSKINITLDNGIIALDDSIERLEKMKHKSSNIKVEMKSLFNDYHIHQSRVEKIVTDKSSARKFAGTRFSLIEEIPFKQLIN
ncbi:GSCOCG00002863001-RA-CDS, partial [Cotesia congregata]